MQEVRLDVLSDRSEYYHKWYEKHKLERHEQHVETYKTYESYVKLTDVKKILANHKKDIGNMSHKLLMNEIGCLQRIRLHGEVEATKTES